MTPKNKKSPRNTKYIWLLALLVLFGCKTKKTAVSTNVQINSETITEKKDTSRIEIDITEVINSDVELVGVIYDTKKPPDPETGKPPVLFEGTIKKKDEQKKEENQEISSVKTTEIKENVISEEKIEVKTKEKPIKLPILALVLLLIVLFIIIVRARR